MFQSTQFVINQKVVEHLYKVADLLEQQGGAEHLIALPNIGTGIARTIYEFVAMECSSRLDSLRGSLEPERLFQRVPGI